jgi:putative FmdB family regulatory protein
MPIYEYSCKTCGNEFELLVRGEMTPECPSCKSQELERAISLPRIKSETTQGLAMRAAKKRDQAQGTDRMHDRLHYEESHDRHGH